jgi:hypothetical protein
MGATLQSVCMIKLPHLTKERADRYATDASQLKDRHRRMQAGKIQQI